ncbi:hypothetical protein LV75_001755 [Actinokineospora diospyrosa]|uniref:XRE family transcriptional regulator n=1 Tax=Actinokineospora diospyrosa TaxID=103728 RepID=A0ABT1I9F5_9PSEU|nr:hypothetical protein [Actinokineospora diospyrosa]
MNRPHTGWHAVARALDHRLRELGWRQRELATRSKVSQAVIRELQYNTIQRKRSTRTLEALSTALDWHPHHLTAIYEGNEPPHHDQPENQDPVVTRLDDIEHRMDALADTLHQIRIDLAILLHRTREILHGGEGNAPADD